MYEPAVAQCVVRATCPAECMRACCEYEAPARSGCACCINGLCWSRKRSFALVKVLGMLPRSVHCICVCFVVGRTATHTSEVHT